HRLDANRSRQVGLFDPEQANEQNRLTAPRKLAGREHLDHLPIDITIEQEVETLERPADRQSAVSKPLFDTSLFPKGRLGCCQQFKKCPESEVLAHTLLEELRQAFGGKVPTQALSSARLRSTPLVEFARVMTAPPRGGHIFRLIELPL